MADQRERWGIVEVLSHSRHDWLNKLQLIKGHLSLKKYDRVKEIIDEIVMEAEQESKLCHLKMPKFAELLLTYNWEGSFLLLDYEVLGKVCDCSRIDAEIHRFTAALLCMMDQCVDQTAENHLTITVELTENQNVIRFFYDFNGILSDDDLLAKSLHEYSSEQIDVQVVHLDTYEFTIMAEEIR